RLQRRGHRVFGETKTKFLTTHVLLRIYPKRAQYHYVDTTDLARRSDCLRCAWNHRGTAGHHGNVHHIPPDEYLADRKAEMAKAYRGRGHHYLIVPDHRSSFFRYRDDAHQQDCGADKEP